MKSAMTMAAPACMPKNVNNIHGIYELMQQMIHQMEVTIASKIDTYQQELNERINVIEARISSIKDVCTVNIEQLTESVEKVRSDSLMARDKLLRGSRANDLVISGVPHTTDEDLRLVFERIAKQLGYKEESVPAVELERLPSSSSIVCRFALRTSRRKFFQTYLKNLSLCLGDIGYSTINADSDGSLGRIYINEYLSRRICGIRSLAMKMKKAGRIQKVLTRDGVIHVKLKDAIVPCYSKQALRDKLNLSA